MPKKKVESPKSKILDKLTINRLTDAQQELKELQEAVLSWTYALEEYMQAEPGGKNGCNLSTTDLLSLSSSINVVHYIKLCELLNKQGVIRSTKGMEKKQPHNVFADKALYEGKKTARAKMEQLQLKISIDKDENKDRDKDAEANPFLE